MSAPILSPAQREIARLQTVVEDQGEEIRRLRRLVSGEVEVPKAWGLKRREEQVFKCLMTRATVAVDRIAFAVYGDEEDGGCEDTIHSHISKLRKKIAPHGLRITCNRGVGYSLIGREDFLARTARA